jgi:O-methyltransferase involved in polyketide biosynthesis
MVSASDTQKRYDVDFSILGQTGLLPLWGRYWWHQNDAFDFKDPFAVKIVEQTNYDFTPIDKHIGGYGLALWGHRSFRLDAIARDHLKQRPQGIVVNLGVGLDDPFQRIDNGQATIIDCDFPDTLNFREKFLPTNTRRVVFKGSFFDMQWLKTIEDAGETTAQICLAGVTMYLKKDQMKELLSTVCEKLPGVKIAFDCLSPRGIRYLNSGMRRSPLPQEEVHWGLVGQEQLRQWIGDGHNIRISSMFEGLVKSEFGWKTRMDIFGAETVRLAQFVEISPK